MRKDGEENIAVGIGFFRREDWEQFIVSADDRENLEDTYDEWLVVFRRAVKDMRATGIKPRKVIFTLDELLDYCQKKGLKNNAEARSEFFAELTRLGKTEEITSL